MKPRYEYKFVRLEGRSFEVMQEAQDETVAPGLANPAPGGRTELVRERAAAALRGQARRRSVQGEGRKSLLWRAIAEV